MIRILIVSPKYPSYENKHAFGFVHARVKVYLSKGLQVKVYVPSNKFYRYTYESVEVYKAPYKYLKEILSDFDPDIICIHSLIPTMLKIINAVSKPIVVWIHGAEVLIRSLHHYYPPFGFKNTTIRVLSFLYDIFRNTLLRILLQKVNAIIYVSHWMQNMAEKYLLYRHPNSHVIPNPVDTNLFKPFTTNKQRIPSSGVTVRALEWKYGIDIATKAFSNFRKSSLTIIGQGSLEPYLRKLAKKLNSSVKFVTKGVDHEKLPRIYNAHGFFVAPSRTEAQGVAMCEAMASGLPVIATNVGGIPEFVIDGHNGLLVPPEDPLSLRRAITRMISDEELYYELAKNARNFAVKNFSHEVIFNRELKIFKEIIS